jgi:hypothetical protein
MISARVLLDVCLHGLQSKVVNKAAGLGSGWTQRANARLLICDVIHGWPPQTASEHCLPQCGIKPIVSDARKYLHIKT